jgi:MoxR-like ATPase
MSPNPITINTNTISPKELFNLLKIAVTNKMNVLITGMPGIGKTDIVYAVQQALKCQLIVSTPVHDSPIDYKGLGAIVKEKNKVKAKFVPFGNLEAAQEAKELTIYFIDDMGQAPPAVQASLMQMIRSNGKKISPHVVFIACTNRKQDMAHVSGMIEPVKSRFKTIVELTVSKDDWIVWAYEHDIAPEVIAFINWMPDMLATEEATMDIVNHPSPRMWEAVSDWLKLGVDSQAVIEGAVGKAAATAFVGFLRVYRSLPNLDNILKNPTREPVPSDPAAKWAIVSSLLGKATKANVENIFKYLERMEVDFAAVFVAGIDTTCPKLKETKAYIKWVTDHPDMLLTK